MYIFFTKNNINNKYINFFCFGIFYFYLKSLNLTVQEKSKINHFEPLKLNEDFLEGKFFDEDEEDDNLYISN